MFAVVHQDELFSRRVGDDLRLIQSEEIQRVSGFRVDVRRRGRPGIDSKLLQQPGIGDRAADGIRVRAFVSDDIGDFVPVVNTLQEIREQGAFRSGGQAGCRSMTNTCE